MSTQRFGPVGANNIKAVDVNLDAFREYKSLEDLKKEPGKIFGHLPAAAQDAAYEELATELGLSKAPATSASVQQPKTAAASAVAQ